MKLKVGARYASRACDTEVIVVRATGEDVDLTCAGRPMADSQTARGQSKQEPVADRMGGAALGKRYTDQAGTLELLVVKPGAGTLAVGDTALAPKNAKALPSSD